MWDYSIQFHTPAASSGWNETALITAFRRGLNPLIRQQMAIYDDTVGLETFISKAVRISQYLTACEEDVPLAPPLSVTSPAPAPEPMQMSFNPLTHVERERRINSGLCLYCGANGHMLQTCPVRPPRPPVSTIQLNPQISTLTRMTIQLISPHTSIPAQALVDSGSSGNFISIETLNRLHRLQPSRLALNRGSRLDFTPHPTLFFSSVLASAVSSHLSIEETPSARLSKLENYGFDQLVS